MTTPKKYCPAIVLQGGSTYYISPLSTSGGLKVQGQADYTPITEEIPMRDVVKSISGEVWGNVKKVGMKRGLLNFQISGMYFSKATDYYSDIKQYEDYLRVALSANEFYFFRYDNTKYYANCFLNSGFNFTPNYTLRSASFSFTISTPRHDEIDGASLITVDPEQSPFKKYCHVLSDTGGEVIMPNAMPRCIHISDIYASVVASSGDEKIIKIPFADGITSATILAAQISRAEINPAQVSGQTIIKINKTGVGGSGESISVAIDYNAKTSAIVNGSITISPTDQLYVFCTASAKHIVTNLNIWIQ